MTLDIDDQSNIRSLVHQLMPSKHPLRSKDSTGRDIYIYIPAICKRTGETVFCEVLVSVANAIAIFRDCQELRPYLPD